MQQKSHEALLKLLNNIGVIGAVLAAIADIVFVLIMVFGINIDVDLNAMIIFAVVNAMIGLLINCLLRYQGQKYAEIENKELCDKFYNRRIREKKYMSMSAWFGLKTFQDIVIKGCTTGFSIFGLIYISVTGSKNPIQILITVASLILFACFGLISMNSAYCRFYNIQVPYMTLKVEQNEQAEIEGENKLADEHAVQGHATEETVENIQEESKEKIEKNMESLDRSLKEENK